MGCGPPPPVVVAAKLRPRREGSTKRGHKGIIKAETRVAEEGLRASARLIAREKPVRSSSEGGKRGAHRLKNTLIVVPRRARGYTAIE